MVAICKDHIIATLEAENRELKRKLGDYTTVYHDLLYAASYLQSPYASGWAYGAFRKYLYGRKLASLHMQRNAMISLIIANCRNITAVSGLRGARGGVIDTEELEARKHRIETLVADVIQQIGQDASATATIFIGEDLGTQIAGAADELAAAVGETSREIQQMIDEALAYASTCNTFYTAAEQAVMQARGTVERVSLTPMANIRAAGIAIRSAKSVRFGKLPTGSPFPSSRFAPLLKSTPTGASPSMPGNPTPLVTSGPDFFESMEPACNSLLHFDPTVDGASYQNNQGSLISPSPYSNDLFGFLLNQFTNGGRYEIDFLDSKYEDLLRRQVEVLGHGSYNKDFEDMLLSLTYNGAGSMTDPSLGICFGTCATMALVYSGDLSISEITDSGEVPFNQLDLRTDERARNTVLYYYVAQGFLNETNLVSAGTPRPEEINDFANGIISEIDNDKPAVVCIRREGGESYNHAVLATGYQRLYDDSGAVTGLTINVWDPNLGDGGSDTIRIDYTTNTWKASLDDKEQHTNADCRLFYFSTDYLSKNIIAPTDENL